MNVRSLCLFVPTLLWACSSPKGPNVTLLVQKPTSAEYSCLGVVGFDVSSTGAGKTAQSGPILNATAVQTSDGCRLDHAFTIDGLNVDAPVTLTVRGYDGAGEVRVSGTGTIDNLNAAATPILLHAEGMPPPYPLILDRQRLLGGIALSDVTSMIIATTKGQPTPLLSVMPNEQTRPYFNVEPGGFGVPGIQDAQELSVEFTFMTGTNLPKQRVVTRLDNTGPVFRVQ